MVVEFTPRYPIMYDWVAIVVFSLGLLLFIWKHGYRNPGWFSFIATQVLILLLFIHWNNIFLNEASSSNSPPSTFGQILMLAPLIFTAVSTLFNAKVNFWSEDGEGRK